MRIEKLQLDDIRYNPELEGFEAIVRVHDEGEVYSYPARVCAPLTAEFKMIARALAQKARAAHSAPAPGLRLRRVGMQDVTRPAPAPATSPLMHWMRKALAA